MKQILLSLISVFATISYNAQTYNWSKSIDGTDSQIGNDITTDNNGNTFVATTLYGTSDISGNAGISSGDEVLASLGSYTGTVLMYDASGSRLWECEIPGVSVERILEYGSDIYFVGTYTSSLSLTTTLNGLVSFSAPTFGSDVIVGQINSDGTLRNVNVFGGFSGQVLDLHMSMNGDALLCSFSLNGSVSYSIYGTSFPSSTFGIDGFLVNINPTTLSDNWINHYSGSFYSETMITGIGDAIDPVTFNPIVIIGGTFAETVDLNPGTGTNNINSSTWDGFIAKYSLTSGSYLQHAVIGSNNYNYINTLELGGNGTAATIFIGGRNSSDCDFDPGIGVVNLPNVQSNEGFLASYDLNLAFKHATSLRGINQQNVTDITITSTSGNMQIGIIGESDGNIAFDTQSGTDTLTQVTPTVNVKKGFVVFLEETTTGIIGKNGFFIESENNTKRKSVGSPKYSASETLSFAVAYNSVGTIAADMNGSSNTALYTNTSTPTTKTDCLIGHYSNENCYSNETLSISTCDASYDFDGNTLTSNGTYTANFINQNGCDSVVILNLVFNLPYDTTLNLTGCGSVESPSGIVYTTSGSFIESFSTSNGCDSIININVIINTIPTATATNDANNMLTASSGSGYQWINCSTSTLIPSENSTTFSPTSNGSYAVIIVSNEGCTDTSSCVSIVSIGLNESSLDVVHVYPNPSSGKFFVQSAVEITQLKIVALNGTQVYISKPQITLLELDINLEKGIYFIEIESSNKKTIKQLIID